MGKSLVTGSSSFLFFPLPSFYREGIFLTTTFCFPFPLSELFQGQIISSTCTFPARKCNLTPLTLGSQCAPSPETAFPLCPPSSLMSKLRKNPGTLYDLSARDERARTISQLKQAIYRRFKLWPTSSCRLWCKMGSWPSLKATRLRHWLTRF